MQDSDLKELKQDVKEIKADICDLKITLQHNTAILDAHHQRTTYNEKRIESLEKWLLGLLTAVLLAVLGKFWL